VNGLLGRFLMKLCSKTLLIALLTDKISQWWPVLQEIPLDAHTYFLDLLHIIIHYCTH
jgi:hypothetical protein